jgi:hypothetical protein
MKKAKYPVAGKLWSHETIELAIHNRKKIGGVS